MYQRRLYYCYDPPISPKTQQPSSCQSDNSIRVRCVVRQDLDCDDLVGESHEFQKRVENGCTYASGDRDYGTALLLSVFFGWLGIDRFYLGYYALGLLKMFSFGFFLILYLVDIVLIALQMLGPASGQAFTTSYYGPRTFHSGFTNATGLLLYSCIDCVT
ncbi:TM2 domain containing protein [Aphelenchoides avenae]|nr:TM2 domain containing protein [Aphelenchus avenae]